MFEKHINSSNDTQILKGDFYRISVLTDKLIRLEYSKWTIRRYDIRTNPKQRLGVKEKLATETPEL